MSVTRTIPAAALRELNLHPGDSLRVLSEDNGTLVVQVQHQPLAAADPAKAIEWVQRARGTVKLEPGETADDVRMAYYREKYGLPD